MFRIQGTKSHVRSTVLKTSGNRTKERCDEMIKFLIDSKIQYIKNDNELGLIKLAATLAVRHTQHKLNNNGEFPQSNSLFHGSFNALNEQKLLDEAFKSNVAKDLYDKLMDNKYLKQICAHQNAILGNTKLELGGPKYTKSAEEIRNYIDGLKLPDVPKLFPHKTVKEVFDKPAPIKDDQFSKDAPRNGKLTEINIRYQGKEFELKKPSISANDKNENGDLSPDGCDKYLIQLINSNKELKNKISENPNLTERLTNLLIIGVCQDLINKTLAFFCYADITPTTVVSNFKLIIDLNENKIEYINLKVCVYDNTMEMEEIDLANLPTRRIGDTAYKIEEHKDGYIGIFKNLSISQVIINNKLMGYERVLVINDIN